MGCAGELPLLEAEIVPNYPALSVLAISSQPETTQAQRIMERDALSFPMLLDFDREMYRFYRRTGYVYPLHVVIDPDGRVAHIDNGPGLEPLKEALDRLIPAP